MKSRLELLPKATGLDEGIRKEAESAYTESLASLTAADSVSKQLASLQALKTNGAQLLELERAAQPPPIDEDALATLSIDELGVQLATAKNTGAVATRTVEAQAKIVADLAERQKRLPEVIADAEKRLREAVAAELASRDLQGDAVRVVARQAAARARVRAARLEREAEQMELDTYTIATELATARRDRAKAEADRSARLVGFLEAKIQQRQQVDALRTRDQVVRRQRELKSNNAVLVTQVGRSVEYAEKRVELHEDLPRLRAQIEKVRADRSELSKKFEGVKQLVKLGGLTQTTGDLLRQHKARLPDGTAYRVEKQKREQEAAQVRVQQILLDERIGTDAELFVDDVIEAEPRSRTSEELRQIQALAKELHQEHNEVLTKLLREYDTRLGELARLETEELLRSRLSEEFTDFIDERILWVRSAAPLWMLTRDQVRTLWSYPLYLRRILPALQDGALANILVCVVGALALILLVWVRPRLRANLDDFGTAALRAAATSFRPTVLALIATVLLAMPIPILFWILHLVLRTPEVAAELGQGPARACFAAGLCLFVLDVLRRIHRRNGLAEAHLGWPEVATAKMRQALGIMVWIGVPGVFFVEGCAYGSEYTRSLVGRSVFIAVWLAMAVVLARLFRPERGILGSAPGWNPGQLGRAWRYVIFLFAALTPMTLIAVATAGFYYTARQLSARFILTLGVFLTLLLVSSVINRWQLVSRRRLAMAQRRQRAAAAAAAVADTASAEAEASPSPEPALDVAEVSAQTRRLVRSAMILTGVVAVFAIWVEVLPAFGALREVELWKTTATVSEEVLANDGSKRIETKTDLLPITLIDAFLFVLTLVMTYVASVNVPGLLKLSILQKARPGNQYAIATLTQYGIVVIGVVVAFAMIGVGWSKVQWLVAAISLGLGFGLQEIFANFVSGLIILFERPIRVGDFVTVGAVRGEVTKIRIRATTIRNLERQELIVPNKQFITGEVINWTLTDTINRIVINVGIAYGSNVELAKETMLRVAQENEYVVEEPRPKVLFKEFGDSALNLEMRVFIKNLDHWPKMVDTVHSAIDREFRRLGIEISFPQRDLHLRTVDAELPVQIADRPGADRPGADQPGADQPGADHPGADHRRTDFPRADFPRADFPRADQPAP